MIDDDNILRFTLASECLTMMNLFVLCLSLLAIDRLIMMSLLLNLLCCFASTLFLSLCEFFDVNDDSVLRLAVVVALI